MQKQTKQKTHEEKIYCLLMYICNRLKSMFDTVETYSQVHRSTRTCQPALFILSFKYKSILKWVKQCHCYHLTTMAKFQVLHHFIENNINI